MKPITMTLVCWLCCCGFSAAQQQSSAQDIVFFSDSGPVMFRLLVSLDGKSLGDHLDPYLTSWFHRLDRDKDDLLDEEEVKVAPSSTLMQQVIQSGYYYPRTNDTLSLSDFTAAQTGVTLGNFLSYYKQAGLTSLNLSQTNAVSSSSPGSSENLFQLLDANNNGKISGSEIATTLSRLHNLDQNENEYLESNELSSYSSSSSGGYQVVRPNTGGRSTGTVPKEFFVMDSQQKRVQLIALMLAKLDKNKDLQLSESEAPLSKEVFDTYDRNRNKKLSVDELTSWSNVGLPITLVVPLGKAQKSTGMELAPGQKLPRDLGYSQTDKETVQFHFGGSNITVRQFEPSRAMMNSNIGRFYMQMYDSANLKDKKAFLLREQLAGQGNRFRILFQIFPIADGNGDDKLTKDELQDFVDFVSKGKDLVLNLSITEEGRGLFELLDTNRDRQISPRELLNAWSQLKQMDSNNDGEFTKDEVARQFTLTVFQGNPIYGRMNTGGLGRPLQGGTSTTNSAAGNAPRWFQKMDTNGDGDVSAREFLGSATLFDELDADNDTLISPAEAIAASKRFES